jgi:cellulose synthase operon protein YhjQ
MTDRKTLVDINETPEDVATLYSWANLHGAKYRDFSASRAQTRENARQRVQQAIEAEHRRTREEAEAQKVSAARLAAETARNAEADRQAEAANRANALRLEQQAAQQRTWNAPPAERTPAPAYIPAAAHAPSIASTLNQPAPPAFPPFVVPQAYEAPANPAGLPTMREDRFLQARTAWNPSLERNSGAETHDSTARPAWLAPGLGDMAGQPAPQPPDDTLQGSRERLTSRWFALKGVFSTPAIPAEAVPAPVAARAPVLAVFSLAGGVGKTSLVATLGRALSSRGERVMLVDTAAYGLLPFFFGARDQRPGVLRTFTPPGSSGDAPIQMLTVDPDTLGPESAPQETLTQEISRNGRGASRIIVDLATASGATTRRVLRMGPTVLVPVIPDMSSVVSVSSIDAFFQHNLSGSGQRILPYYVLNQFDASLPLHLDVREVLREQLGDRLLPFALRRTPAVSEALAEGMTVVDYAPNSSAAEDFGSLASWVKSLAAPATTNYRGVRWSER